VRKAASLLPPISKVITHHFKNNLGVSTAMIVAGCIHRGIHEDEGLCQWWGVVVLSSRPSCAGDEGCFCGGALITSCHLGLQPFSLLPDLFPSPLNHPNLVPFFPLAYRIIITASPPLSATATRGEARWSGPLVLKEKKQKHFFCDPLHWGFGGVCSLGCKGVLLCSERNTSGRRT